MLSEFKRLMRVSGNRRTRHRRLTPRPDITDSESIFSPTSSSASMAPSSANRPVDNNLRVVTLVVQRRISIVMESPVSGRS